MTISHDLPHPAPARAGNLATTGQRHVEVTERGARLVILIPSYNEEKAIARVVEKTMQVLSRFSSNFSIAAIDDGSKDNTRSILDKMKGVERFYHRYNLGKGDVIRNALGFFGKDEIVITMDGDGEHDPEDLPRLIAPVLAGKADIVIGSRFMNAGKNVTYLGREKRNKFINNLGNRLFSFLLWIFTRKGVQDTQSGFRAFRSEAVRDLHLSADGFRIEMEMTVKAIRRGLRVVEVPINNGEVSRRSHLHFVLDGIRIAMTVFRECLPRRVMNAVDYILPRMPKRLSSFVKR